jgi:hypothetical protein
MALDEPRPLRIRELRRPFSSEAALLRLARQLELTDQTRLLEVGGGLDGWAIPLAQAVGCPAVIAETDEAVLEALGERVRASGVGQKVELRRVAPDRLPFEEGAFDAVIGHTGPKLPARTAAQRLAAPVGFDGHLALLAVTQVGRNTPAQVLNFWGDRVGEVPLSPRELLQAFADAGFEPNHADALSDAELADLYRAAEKSLGKDVLSDQLREEIAFFRGQNGRSGYSFSVLSGRRRRPGETPGAPRSGA